MVWQWGSGSKNKKAARRPLFLGKVLSVTHSGNAFLDLALLNATGANPHSLTSALGEGDANLLQIGVPSLDADVMGVRNLVTLLITFVAYTANLCHDPLQQN